MSYFDFFEILARGGATDCREICGRTTRRAIRLNSSSLAAASISSAVSMKRRDCSLRGFAFPGINRLAVGEPLTDDTTDQTFGALFIINAERSPIVVAEIEFGGVAVQVLLIAMLIDALHPALEHRKEPFNGVRVHIAPAPFVPPVVDGFMRSKLAANPPVVARLIGYQGAAKISILHDDAPNAVGVDALNLDRSRAALALDQSDDLHLVAPAGLAAPALAIDEFLALPTPKRFVDFQRLPLAAERPRAALVVHREPDAMRHVPGGFHVHAERPLKLSGADALLAAAHEIHRLKPEMQRRVTGFKDGADLDGEGLAAGVALVSADPSALALQLPAAIDNAAMGADATARPNDALDPIVCGLLVMEPRVLQNWVRHRPISLIALIILPILGTASAN